MLNESRVTEPTLIIWSHNTRTLHSRPTHSPGNAIHFTGVSDNIISLDLIAEQQPPRPKRQSYIPPLHSQCIVKLLSTMWLVHRQKPKCAFFKQCHTMMHYVIWYDHWAMMSGIYRPAVLLGGRQWYVHMYVEEVWFDDTLLASIQPSGCGKWGRIDFGLIWGRKRGRRCVSGRYITLECFQMKEFVHTQHTS
jgi:hypothetical protein